MKRFKSQRGVLAIDFIFALTLGMGFAVVFLIFTLSLSLVEVAQYISFSSSRAFMAAHETPNDQMGRGRSKFNQLRNRPVFRAVFRPTWFQLGSIEFGDFNGAEETGVFRGFNDEFRPDPLAQVFIGVRIPSRIRLLSFNWLGFGPSTSDPDTGVANIQSFLGREVSTTECREIFNRQRFNKLISSPQASHFQAAQPSSGSFSTALITDNGC